MLDYRLELICLFQVGKGQSASSKERNSYLALFVHPFFNGWKNLFVACIIICKGVFCLCLPVSYTLSESETGWVIYKAARRRGHDPHNLTQWTRRCVSPQVLVLYYSPLPQCIVAGILHVYIKFESFCQYLKLERFDFNKKGAIL